ncbi:MAG TPA: glycoside hydrolase family 3 C-terminal domain-containing protein, partial [Sedimentisphaerales bacterium]|nr:glycoside hydrolase family 3 C-terminal domain-containing protein [Sedimentisphaerales bacterium]
IEIASKADIVLIIGGNNRTVETEGSDRKNIFLPSGQDSLITQLAKVNPHIITVLTSGAPNDLNVVNPLSKALLLSWFNGTEGGNALADVIVGNISPSGRLPFTLPVKLEDSPAYSLDNYNNKSTGSDIFANLLANQNSKQKDNKTEGDKSGKDQNTANYSEESLVGYRWFDTKNIKVMYPFGFGLTYTNFEYSDLKTDKEKYGKDDVISVSFELKNTGSVVADEVAQVYVHRIDPTVEWPNKELKAFTRVTLNTGESKKVTLKIPVKELQYWDKELQTWNNDFCKIGLLVGASVNEIKLEETIKLKQ